MRKAWGVQVVLFDMKEVFQYLLDNCRLAMIHQNELIFVFDDKVSFVFSFDKQKVNNENEYFSYNFINEIKYVNSLIRKVGNFDSFMIREYEELSWREDDFLYSSSTSYKMYMLYRVILKTHPNAIKRIQSKIIFDNDFCDKYGKYTFMIFFQEEYWGNINIIKEILNANLENLHIPNFYSHYFMNRIEVKDDKQISIVSTNTKVRRLGYFKLLSSFMVDYKMIPSISINKKFENYCLPYQEVLINNQHNKGVIKETKNGISAKPYIDVANEFDLVNIINRVYYTGKLFKVYEVLQKKYSDEKNPFKLSSFDKLFFLEMIIKYDYFYFRNLLELIFVEEKISYSDIKDKFQNQVLNQIIRYKNSVYNDRKVISIFDLVYKRINNWEKPHVYLEHIIMPRLNWMLDLGVIIEKNNKFEITKVGEKLFHHFCIWNDLNTDEVVNPTQFVNNFMVNMFDDCFNYNQITTSTQDMNFVKNMLFECVENSFDFFKTLAPNRVTASQAINYAKYMLYLENGIRLEYQNIIDILSSKEQMKFIYKFQEQYQDGYIQIKK